MSLESRRRTYVGGYPGILRCLLGGCRSQLDLDIEPDVVTGLGLVYHCVVHLDALDLRDF